MVILKKSFLALKDNEKKIDIKIERWSSSKNIIFDIKRK